MLETYHNEKFWIKDAIDVNMEQIELLTGLLAEPQRGIKSTMRMTKQKYDDDIRTKLGDGEKLIVISRGIVISRINNMIRR